MQVFPATAVKGNSEKDNAEEEPAIQKDPYPPLIAFSAFRQNPELPAPSEEKGRDESNSGSEERSEDRWPGTLSPCLFDSQLKNYFYPAGESIDFEFAYQAYPSKSLRRSGNSSAGFFVPGSPPSTPASLTFPENCQNLTDC